MELLNAYMVLLLFETQFWWSDITYPFEKLFDEVVFSILISLFGNITYSCGLNVPFVTFLNIFSLITNSHDGD